MPSAAADGAKAVDQIELLAGLNRLQPETMAVLQVSAPPRFASDRQCITAGKGEHQQCMLRCI